MTRLESAVCPRARAGLLSGGESVYQRGNEGKTQPVFSAKTATYGVVAVFSVILNEQCPHNNLLLTDAHRRVLALSPTQPGARHDYALLKAWELPSATATRRGGVDR